MKPAVFVALLVVMPYLTAASCAGKTVEVWLANGFGLTGDGLSNPGPYVLVQIGDRVQRTRVIHSTSNPSWFQKFMFDSGSNDFMKIDVWEKDGGLRGDDDHLGTCIQQMASGDKSFQPVRCTVQDNGVVKLFYKCY